MKIKQITGRDMRDALRQVRASLGPDAILLATRSVRDGVEVTAAVDAEHLHHAPPDQIRDLMPRISAMRPVEPPSAAPVAAPVVLASAAPVVPVAPVSEIAPAATVAPPVTAAIPAVAALVAEAAAANAEQQAMSEELKILRQLLERQLAALAWNDFTRREPLRARALTELTELGLARDVALSLLEEFPAQPSAEQAQRIHYGLLAKRLASAPSPIEQGGVLALIGASGAGRTSMIAKLGHRWLREHARESLVIATIDGGHLGAAEQARLLGRTLGVESYRFADAEAFADGEHCIEGRELVLIDTPALTGEEADAVALASGLAGICPDLRSMLLLPASTQAGALDEVVRRAAPFNPTCCAVTRCDESVSLGGVLSALVRSTLPVAFISDGPRISEDLRTARSHQLVARAAELARESLAHADEDLLARRFGGQVNAAA
jgi:flagellar biosynthesis protein FlhF